MVIKMGNEIIDISEFVKVDLYKEDHQASQPISLRVSDRLKKTIPRGNVQTYLRTVMDLAYIIRFSPYRTEILSHLGFDDQLTFNLEWFQANFKNGYFKQLF